MAFCVKSELEKIARLTTAELQSLVDERTAKLESEINRRKEVERLLRLEHSKLEVQANLDPLTGLKNRRAISDDIINMGVKSRALGVPFTILFVDVDYFKQVNDTYGHSAGDEVLKIVAPTPKIGRTGHRCHWTIRW